MANIIPSGQLIKLLHDRLEKQANNTLRGKDLDYDADFGPNGAAKKPSRSSAP